MAVEMERWGLARYFLGEGVLLILDVVVKAVEKGSENVRNQQFIRLGWGNRTAVPFVWRGKTHKGTGTQKFGCGHNESEMTLEVQYQKDS